MSVSDITTASNLQIKLIDDINDDSHKKCSDSNLNVLYITTASFLLFVIAEIIGAIASNSLALLGDAAAMSVDVFTYACGIWVERIKARGGKMTKFVRLMTEVYIPGFSVLALLSVSAWVTSDAVSIIIANDASADDVDIKFLYGFAGANFLVDLVSSYAFYRKKDDVFFDASDEDENVALTRSVVGLNDSEVINEISSERGESIGAETSSHLAGHLNLNMASAFTHVGGDTLRTAAIFIAAVVTTTTSIRGNICDAWADVIVTITIVFLVIPLVKEIAVAWIEISKEKDEPQTSPMI